MNNTITTTSNGRKAKTDAPYTRLPDAPTGFRRRPDGDIMDAHREWASRPADEAVATADEYLRRTREVRGRSKVFDVSAKDLRAVTTDDGRPALARVNGKAPLALNRFALDALCGDIKAPPSYLATLPAPLVQSCLQYGLDRMADKQVRILATGAPDGAIVRALTSTKYTRLWDAELAERIHTLCERTSWGPATAFRSASGTRHTWGDVEPLPLGWVGDRSSFVVLVDYETRVKLNGNEYFRFMLLSNSEVGAASFKVVFGLLDMVCCNFILWGCTEVYEASFRHIGERFADRVAETFAAVGSMPALDAGKLERQAYLASKHLLGDGRGDVVAKVRAKTLLPIEVIEEGFERALKSDRYGDARSVWGMVNGLTEASQHRAGFADARADIDTAAARLFDFAF